jgi:hypothetical protein
MFSLLKARWVFICGALLLLLANGAHGGGSYQRTKDGKTFVWDNSPKPHEAATWSGHRDTDGYATGSGTLTWYTVEQKMVTGTNLPSLRYTVISSFTGTMVHGKFEGSVVDLDPNGKKLHAKFVDGKRTGDWIAGVAPSKAEVATNDERRDEDVRRPELKEPSAPAEEPSVAQEAEVTDRPANQADAEPKVRETRNPATDDSLESLISVPSFLRMSNRTEARPQPSILPAVSSSPAGPRLIQAEVIGLADAAASAQGYNLDEYRRTLPQYTEETWSVSYDSKSVDVDANGMGGIGKHFVVSVEDKTKKASVAPGK